MGSLPPKITVKESLHPKGPRTGSQKLREELLEAHMGFHQPKAT